MTHTTSGFLENFKKIYIEQRGKDADKNVDSEDKRKMQSKLTNKLEFLRARTFKYIL